MQTGASYELPTDRSGSFPYFRFIKNNVERKVRNEDFKNDPRGLWGRTLARLSSNCFCGHELKHTRREARHKNLSLKTGLHPFETSNALEGLGGASIKTEIESGDKTWKLLPTFNDPEQAIESIKNKSSKAINLLREEFDLPEFSSESWDKYRAAIYRMYEREGCPSWYVEGNDEINALESFFDIYENEDDNEEIENTLISAQISPLSTEQDQDRAEEELLETLPDQNVLNENGYDEDNAANEGARARKDFNVAKGVAYAKKYAGSKNFPKYAYFTWPFGGDCTNFASQILEAGGVKQIKSSDDKKGWWHKSHNGAHTHSQSWIKARTFAKYMGVSYKTKSHKSFSKKVKKRRLHRVR